MKKNHRFSILVAGTLLLALLAVCSAQSGTQNNATVNTASVSSQAENVPQFQERNARYRLVSGDVFDVNFDLTPEFNQQQVSVQPDGFVTLRGVGDINVAGLTIPQLREAIRNAYSKTLHDPIISVTLREYQKPFFVADGQLGHPGRYELHGPVTLTEGIAMAGGFLDSAKHSQVVLYRRVNDQWTSAQIINVKKMEGDRDLKEDPLLHPGDMLFVPKNRMSKVKPFIPTSNVGMAAYGATY
ncbi:MAG: polysaccharide biosynthesis/export family protein [Terriglobales bacterium]